MAENSGRSRLGGLICGPVLVFGGILALWQNEGRFDYARAAADATIISVPARSEPDPIAYSGDFDTAITVPGQLVARFDGYFHVWRDAEIYAWDLEERSSRTTWTREWQDTLDSNSRNRGLTRQLHDRDFRPGRFRIGGLDIDSSQVHFADDAVLISPRGLLLKREARRLGLEVRGEYLYRSTGSDNPSIGDERVRYLGLVPKPTMTYFGLIAGGAGAPHQEDTGGGIINDLIVNDGILHHVVAGERETALETMANHFSRMVWLVRAGGSVAIVLGIYVFFSVFTSILYSIPLLGWLVEAGVLLVSLALGLPIALAVIIAGVLVNNPLTAALPLALVVAGILYVRRQQAHTQANAGQTRRKILAARAAAPAAGAPGYAARVDTLAPAGAMALAGALTVDGSGRVEETFRHLTALALADDTLDKREQRLLVNWGRGEGIPGERMKALFAEIRSSAEPPAPADRSDVQLLVCMALADGVVSGREWDLLVRFGKAVGMSTKDLKQMIVDLRSASPAPA